MGGGVYKPPCAMEIDRTIQIERYERERVGKARVPCAPPDLDGAVYHYIARCGAGTGDVEVGVSKVVGW